MLGGWAVAGLSNGGDHVAGCFGTCVRRFGRGLLCHFGGEHLDRDGGLNPHGSIRRSGIRGGRSRRRHVVAGASKPASGAAATRSSNATAGIDPLERISASGGSGAGGPGGVLIGRTS